MSSTTTTTSRAYGPWQVVRTTPKEGDKQWVTVVPASSSPSSAAPSAAAAKAAQGYGAFPVMGTADDPTEKTGPEGEGDGSACAYAFDASLVGGCSFSPWLQAPRWKRLAGAAAGGAGAGVAVRATDVMVATYPKSGTTLAEQAILLFMAGGDASLLAPQDKNALGRRDPKDAKFCKVRHPIYYTTASVPLFSP